MGRVIRILALVSVFAGCLYVFTLLPWFGKIYEERVQQTQMAATAPIQVKLPAPRAIARRQAQEFDGTCKTGKADPNCVPKEMAQVTDLIDAGKIEEARDLLLQMLKSRPTNVSVLSTLGLVFRNRFDDPESAALYFRRALEANSDRPDLAHELAEIYLESTDLDEGVRVFRSLDNRHPRNAFFKMALGELELEQGDDDTAVAHLELASRLMPDLPKTYDLLAEAHVSNGHPERAALALQKLLRMNQEWREVRVAGGEETDDIDTEIARLRARIGELRP